MTTPKAQIWAQRLAESRQALLTLLTKLEPDQWHTPVYSEGAQWTVMTAVAHLIDSERGMSVQVHKTRKGQETVPVGFDIDHWNAGVQERIGEQTPEQLLALLAATRAKTLDVMASLKEEEWALQGRHPSRGVITIEQYYETIALHEQLHTADIQRAVEAN
jgi:uncharacterized protein (TIGR03083 family)